MRPRVPLPIGQKRSTARVVIRSSFISIFKNLSGDTVVRPVNSVFMRRSSSGRPSTVLDELDLGIGKAPLGRESGAADQTTLLQLEAADEFLWEQRCRSACVSVFPRSRSWPLPPLAMSMSRIPSMRTTFSGGADAGAAGAGKGAGSAAGPAGLAPASAEADGAFASSAAGGAGLRAVFLHCPAGRTRISFPYNRFWDSERRKGTRARQGARSCVIRALYLGRRALNKTQPSNKWIYCTPA